MGLIEKGQIYASNSFGDFVVLEDLCNSKYKIKFINTGYETIVSSAAILGGRVKDKYVPNIAGVGFLGSFEGKVTVPNVIIFYRPWNDMMNRCYNVTDEDYPMYGALGITVDPRWYNFGNFFEDAKTLPGYENKLREPTMYNLDKDYLQQDVPDNQKVYSKDYFNILFYGGVVDYLEYLYKFKNNKFININCDFIESINDVKPYSYLYNIDLLFLVLIYSLLNHFHSINIFLFFQSLLAIL